MDDQRQDDQLEPTYSSLVPIRDVALKTCRKQLTIGRGGERESEISALIARHDDEEEVDGLGRIRDGLMPFSRALHKVKRKQHRPGFEFQSLTPFLTATLSVSPSTFKKF